jgi:signal peptidase I
MGVLFVVDNFLATGRRGWLRASWGGLLSLTIPGLGQVYARAWRIGLTLIAATLLLEALARGCTRVFPPTPAMMTALVLPGIGLSLAVRSGAAWDAVRRIRRRSDQAPQTWKGSTWLAAILVIALDVALDQSIPAGWRAFSIPSGSNIPTLIVGDRFFADIRDPGFVPLAGDMVVFRHPRDPSVEFVKRVVGLPGERVQMKGGYLYIDGQAAPREPAGEIEDEGAEVDPGNWTGC